MASDQYQPTASVESPGLALSNKAVAVMELIAQGHSYEQILATYPALTYRDIFDAAAEVLESAEDQPPSQMEKTKRKHPRAYEKWTQDEEEQQLRDLIAEGHTVGRIAGRLQRNRGGIRARIVQLGLVEQLSSKEQERLNRIRERERGHDGE